MELDELTAEADSIRKRQERFGETEMSKFKYDFAFIYFIDWIKFKKPLILRKSIRECLNTSLASCSCQFRVKQNATINK